MRMIGITPENDGKASPAMAAAAGGRR